MIDHQQGFDPAFELKIQSWLESQVGFEHFDPSFERLKKLFAPIKTQLQQNGIFIVTIGGTNGKGETSLRLYQALEQARQQLQAPGFGLWTSPHILSIRERFVFQGKLLDYQVLWQLMQKHWQEVAGLKLSYYEFLFYCFCQHALSLGDQLQGLVLEVGLGGRLDGVNVLDPNVTCITSIARDHVAILGPGLRNILGEKLGITRSGVPLVTALSSAYLRELARDYAQTHHIPHEDLFELGLVQHEQDFSARNQQMAHRLWDLCQGQLQIAAQASPAVFGDFPLKGRFEMMTLGVCRFIFIGSHNREGLRVLVQGLSGTGREMLKARGLGLPLDYVLCSFSKRESTEVKECLEILKRAPCLYKSLKLTSFEHFKALAPEQWEVLIESVDFKHETASYQADWKRWIQQSLAPASGALTSCLVTGSYYFIGEVQKFLLSEGGQFSGA